MSGDYDSYVATELIYSNNPVGAISFNSFYNSTCCFCSRKTKCVDSSEVISSKYFTDYDLVSEKTGSICKACAYCMSNKSLKNGHWLVTCEDYLSVSTSDLKGLFEDLVADEIDKPYALHVSSNPVLSEHAYLTTPVCYSSSELLFDYDGSTVNTDGEELFKLVDGIEVLRWNRFRLDDIRSSEPPISSVDDVGVMFYKQIDDFLSKYTENPIFEVAITLSNGRSDQNRDGSDIEEIIEKYDWT